MSANTTATQGTELAKSVINTPDLEQLLADDRVRIRSWLQPEANSVVGQQLELNIEVATDGWFSGGSRVDYFELDDAIVLRRNKFAVNSSRREAGSTWSVQLWTITIYPQRPGHFSLPPINVRVSVANPEHPDRVVQGIVQTSQIEFESLIPDSIKTQSVSQWIASNEFTVSDDFDKPITNNLDEHSLTVGDALRRTITLRAENVAAMMLPSINISSAPGLAAYMRPARLEDRVNRGTYLALRREVISYVAEEAGTYTLPAITLHWWNTQSATLEQVQLPAYTLTIAASDKDKDSVWPGVSLQSVLYWLMGLLLCALLLYQSARNNSIRAAMRAVHKFVFPPENQLKRELIKGYPAKDPAAHGIKMLQWLASQGLHTGQSARAFIATLDNHSVLAIFEQLMQHAFHNNSSAPTVAEFKILITALQRAAQQPAHTNRHTERPLNPREDLSKHVTQHSQY